MPLLPKHICDDVLMDFDALKAVQSGGCPCMSRAVGRDTVGIVFHGRNEFCDPVSCMPAGLDGPVSCAVNMQKAGFLGFFWGGGEGVRIWQLGPRSAMN